MVDRYLDLLTPDELHLLGTASGLPHEQNPLELFRSHPVLIAEALGKQVTLDRLATMDGAVTAESSTRLRLAIMTTRLAAQITAAGFGVSRLGDRVLVEAGANDDMAQVVATNRFRLDVIELIFSYLRPGRDDDEVAVVADPDRLRRALASHHIGPLIQLLDWLPTSQHAGVLRRLGDLAALTVGLFPDHGDALTVDQDLMVVIARTVPSRLRDHLTGVAPIDAFGADTMTAMLERLGPIWYRRAAQLISWPAIAEPIESLADNFDVMTSFLGELNRYHLLDQRDDLFDFGLIHGH